MMSDNSGISLRVFENETKDKGRNIVRIDPEIMQTLNISEGDLISIISGSILTMFLPLSLVSFSETLREIPELSDIICTLHF